MNHLIFDGISVWILVNDLNKIYSDLNNQKKTRVANEKILFSEYALALENYKTQNLPDNEIEYWRALAQKNICGLNTGMLNNRQTNMSYKSVCLAFKSEFARILKNILTKKYNAKISDILLSILGWTSSEWNNSQCVYINTFNNGRDFPFANNNILETAGPLAIKFPVVFDFSNINNLDDAVKEAIVQINNIPEKGRNYGLLKYKNYSESDRKIFDKLSGSEITFNYLSSIYLLSEINSWLKFMSPKLNKNFILHNTAINIIAHQMADNLIIIWNFDDTIISENILKQIINKFTYNLNLLILENLY